MSLGISKEVELEMQEMLLEVWEREKTTVLFITHDIDEAIFLSQRIIVMRVNPGTIIKQFDVTLPSVRTAEIREHLDLLKLRHEIVSLLKH